jgi:hypothetical protein
MERTHAYRTIMQAGVGICLVMLVVLYSMLYEDNYYPILLCMCGLGFFALPMLPVMIECCVECTYPLSEGLSVGWLHNGAGLFGVAVVFVSQRLLDLAPLGPPPFDASSLFVIGR